MKWLPENDQLLLISFTSVKSPLNLIWIPLALLLYKNNLKLSIMYYVESTAEENGKTDGKPGKADKGGAIIPDVATNLLSWRLWILLYVVLMGILVSAVI